MIRELARAKINLTLRVLGRRPDGYHEIESVVAFADLGDELLLDTTAPAGLETAGPFADRIDGANLVGEAMERVRAADPRLRLGHVRLEKRLPVAAGIGGGSADAAALLRAVRRANPGLADAIDWASIAAGLGADVPVCLASEPSLMRGVGEQIRPLSRLPALDVVLVNPLVPVPHRKTAMVFKTLDAPLLGRERSAEPIEATRLERREELLHLMRHHGNDLTAAASEIMPDIVAVMTALERMPDVELAQLSGAGPTCFGVFTTRSAALNAEAGLRADHPEWWIETARIG